MTTAYQRRQNVGAEHIHSIHNASGNTLVKGVAVMLDTTATNGIPNAILPSGITVPLYGIVMHDILDGDNGPVQTHGVAVCLAKAAVANVGVSLMSGTDGKMLTFNAGGAGNNCQMVGINLTAATGEDDYFEVQLSGPGNVRQG